MNENKQIRNLDIGLLALNLNKSIHSGKKKSNLLFIYRGTEIFADSQFKTESNRNPYP